MKSFALYALGFFILVAGAVIYSGFEKPAEETISEPSNTVQLGESENTFITLSETFARQLNSFGFEFGDFSTVPSFLGFTAISEAGDTAKVEILKDSSLFLTIFELPLPTTTSYAEMRPKIEDALPATELRTAVFGPDSFYYLQDDLSINILPLGGSVLAFQFDSQNFTEIRSFIASLIILQ